MRTNVTRARVRSAIVVFGAALALAGCGGGDGDAGDPRDAVSEFVDARTSADFEAECEMYADELKAELGVGRSCPELLRETRAGSDAQGRVRIVDVRERDGRAQAELDVPGEGGEPARISLLLEERDGRWQVIAFP